MKADEVKLLGFLEKSSQFVIPIYQRIYSWTERECGQLLDDILRVGNDEAIKTHFIGSIVYIGEGYYQVSARNPLLVIDGQQRLTTLTLIIEALARYVGNDEPVKDFSAKKLRDRYLLDPNETGEAAHKLILTQTDKETLFAIVQQRLPFSAGHSLRLKENFEFFNQRIKDLGSQLEPLCKGLTKLGIVDISLDRDRDDPQLIFESMNSTGLDLSHADLIRNFLLMGLKPDRQERIYKEHWRPIEVAFGQEAYGEHFSRFMRYYLTVKTGELPSLSEVYEKFKAYAGKPQVKDGGVDNLVTDVQAFAGYYCAMALGKETKPLLKAAFDDLRELKADVAYPFLLELYRDYKKGLLSEKELEQAVRLVESYVFRRAGCEMSAHSLSKVFAAFGRALDKNRYLDSIQAHFLLLPSSQHFPLNREFRLKLKARDLYNFNRRNYWLRRLENHGRKERVSVEEYTIEHIMPQNKNLVKEWRDALGDEWQQVQDAYLHTLGNLTLTGYNSEYSDHPFAKKRDMKGGFKNSPLLLNEGLGTLNTWDKAAIQERAERLADKATVVWAEPSLSEETLNTYRKQKPEKKALDIDDHKHIAQAGPMRRLFEAFRKEVFALDPGVITEDVLKHHVAYKADANFVGVIPQARQLQLCLNLKFHEIHDPRGIAKDITNIGHWATGDVRVNLGKLGDITYVMGLVRQAFDKQMGEDGTK